MAALNPALLDHIRTGVVVLGPSQKVEARYGTIVDWVPPGVPASEAIPLLVGLEDVLDEVVTGRRPSLKLPKVTQHAGAMADKVLSFDILPAETADGLLILVRDETENADLEQRVVQQRNELALANAALARAREQAEAALREKAAFLANISHDLKTPLQVIIGNAEILRGDVPSGERGLFLQDVLDNSNFLLALINDLLDASALEAGQLTLVEDVVDIEAMLDRILSMARGLPNGKDRQFTIRHELSRPSVLADPMRLQRLLLNLVSNAVKFTEKQGLISIGVRVDAKGDLLVEVEDDGSGIQPEMLARAFEPFTRDGGVEGSGLGLHIAKGLADLHGADLTLASEPGMGTKARLRLPKSRVVQAPI